jgi:hypothetical protein
MGGHKRPETHATGSVDKADEAPPPSAFMSTRPRGLAPAVPSHDGTAKLLIVEDEAMIG